jgi:Putative auto-transporter adhesin, head GIN domain
VRDRVMALICVGALIMTEPLMAQEKIQTQQFPQPAFSAVSVQIPADVEIKSSTRSMVTVTAEPKVIAALRLAVRGSVLMLDSKSFQTTQGIKILVEGPPIKSLKVGSSGSVVIRELTIERFVLESDSSTEITVTGLSTESLKLDVSGSETVKLSGKTKSLDLNAQGSSEVDASALAAQTVVAQVSGAATAQVNASVDLRAVASESATIKYRGGARIKQQVSDAADIAKVN